MKNLNSLEISTVSGGRYCADMFCFTRKKIPFHSEYCTENPFITLQEKVDFVDELSIRIYETICCAWGNNTSESEKKLFSGEVVCNYL